MTGVDLAVQKLRAGSLACFPTETVWGLACRATDPAAAERVRAIKGRPADLPLAVAFASWDDAWPYIEATAGAKALAARFLPGPLSIVLRRSDDELAHLTPGRDTLSVRVPVHPVARDILRGTGPLALTSANRHGESEATDRAAAAAAVAGHGDVVVVDWAEPVAGVASTVVDATGARPAVLREGSISTAEVEAAWP